MSNQQTPTLDRLRADLSAAVTIHRDERAPVHLADSAKAFQPGIDSSADAPVLYRLIAHIDRDRPQVPAQRSTAYRQLRRCTPTRVFATPHQLLAEFHVLADDAEDAFDYLFSCLLGFEVEPLMTLVGLPADAVPEQVFLPDEFVKGVLADLGITEPA